MRYLIALLLNSLVVSALMLAPHLAQATAGNAASSETVVIIEDPNSKSFRFVIEGKEVARLDQSGLYVRESIAYGGTISDVGVEHYDQGPSTPQGKAE